MSEKRMALRRLLFILLGMLPILVAPNDKSAFKFVQVAGFLFAGYQLLMLIASLQFLLDEISPAKHNRYNDSNAYKHPLYWISTLVFFIAAILLLLQIRSIDNTIHGSALFWKFAIVGLFFSVIILWLIKRFYTKLYDESYWRVTLLMGVPLTCFMLFPAIANIVNNNTEGQPVECRSVEIKRKGSDSRDREHYIFCDTGDGEEERFVVSRDLWNSLYEGGLVELCMQQGRIGYAVVKKIRRCKP